MNTPQKLLEYYKYGITVFVNNYPVDLSIGMSYGKISEA